MIKNSSTLFTRTLYSPDNTATALLIHGLGSSSSTWRDLSKDLFKSGYNIIAPDLFGHGRSPHSETYSLQEWVNSILTLNIKPDLIVGHSMGGLIASLVQEKLGAKKLILLDPVFFLPKDKFMNKNIQFGFKAVMLSKKFRVGRKLRKFILTKRAFIVREVADVLRWDTKTSKALIANPKTIVKRLQQGTERILLVRARGSYILPSSVLKRQFREGVELYSMKAGHNLHHENYPKLWDLISKFLKGDINEGNFISSTATL